MQGKVFKVVSAARLNDGVHKLQYATFFWKSSTRAAISFIKPRSCSRLLAVAGSLSRQANRLCLLP